MLSGKSYLRAARLAEVVSVYSIQESARGAPSPPRRRPFQVTQDGAARAAVV